MSGVHRRWFRWGWSARLLTSAALAALLFASALLLHQPLPHVATVPNAPVDFAAAFPSRIDAVTAALAALPWPLPPPHEEPQGAGALRWVHRRYQVTLPQRQTAAAIEETLAPVRGAAAGVTLGVTEEPSGVLVQVGVDGLLTHTLVLRWLDRHPRLAIVLDDLGNDLLLARGLVDIDAPLTLAIVPFRPFSKEIAELATLFGREVLLQLPIQGDGASESDSRGLLRLAAARNDLLHALEEDLAAVPHIVGVSAPLATFGAAHERLDWTLGTLKERGLFIVDSSPTPPTAACSANAGTGSSCSLSIIRLEDTEDEAAATRQLEATLTAVAARGDSVVIGHARAALAALRAVLPQPAGAAVDLVPASAVLRDQSLSSH